MTAVAHLYNTLPTLGDADPKFIERDSTFKQLGKLLSNYDGGFGACLVHAHYRIAEGEAMLVTGNISKPVQPEEKESCFPERWMVDGTPYEFTT